MRNLVVLVLVLAQAGCVTIISGTTQEIRFTSQPPGATVVLGSQQTTTPGSLVVQRGYYSHCAIVTLPGYEQAVLTIGGRLDPLYFLDIFAFGIGFLVDTITGAWIRYEDSVNVPLNPQG